MLWQVSIEPQRHTPCGEIAMSNFRRQDYLAASGKHDEGRWR